MADTSKERTKPEERLEEDLAHLNELHLKLRNLRSALERMMEPMARKQSSPQELYDSFMNSVNKTQKEISQFKEEYTSDKTKSIIHKGAESRKANPQGIKPWRATDDPNWATQQHANDLKPTRAVR